MSPLQYCPKAQHEMGHVEGCRAGAGRKNTALLVEIFLFSSASGLLFGFCLFSVVFFFKDPCELDPSSNLPVFQKNACVRRSITPG